MLKNYSVLCSINMKNTNSNLIELVEVKPSKQAGLTESKSRRDKAAVILNKAKWTAAQEWCKRRGIKFRIVTENEIYHKP